MPQTIVKPVNYTPTLLLVGGSRNRTSFPEMPLRSTEDVQCSTMPRPGLLGRLKLQLHGQNASRSLAKSTV